MPYEFVSAPLESSSIKEPPQGTLEHFSFVKLTNGETVTTHALGYRRSDGVTYITSALTAFDPANNKVRSARGKVWRLEFEDPEPDHELEMHLLYALETWGIPR